MGRLKTPFSDPEVMALETLLVLEADDMSILKVEARYLFVERRRLLRDGGETWSVQSQGGLRRQPRPRGTSGREGQQTHFLI